MEEKILNKELEGDAYKAAYVKADKASIVSRMKGKPSQNIRTKEDDSSAFGDDDEELRKSLSRARKVALKKQDEVTSFTRLTSITTSKPTVTSGETQEKKVIFTELEEFVRGLQLDKEAHQPDNEDMSMEYLTPNSLDHEMKDIDNNDDGWSEVKNSDKEEPPAYVDIIRETPVGKGLSGALKVLKDRGTLKETVECGGRNMEKRKGILVGIRDEYGHGRKEIRLERTDEYGNKLTPKEAYILISHKFHGKGPGIRKQKKRKRRYEEELKVKRIMNSDMQSQSSIERMRQVQARLRTPYLVLSGHV